MYEIRDSFREISRDNIPVGALDLKRWLDEPYGEGLRRWPQIVTGLIAQLFNLRSVNEEIEYLLGFV